MQLPGQPEWQAAGWIMNGWKRGDLSASAVLLIFWSLQVMRTMSWDESRLSLRERHALSPSERRHWDQPAACYAFATPRRRAVPALCRLSAGAVSPRWPLG